MLAHLKSFKSQTFLEGSGYQNLMNPFEYGKSPLDKSLPKGIETQPHPTPSAVVHKGGKWPKFLIHSSFLLFPDEINNISPPRHQKNIAQQCGNFVDVGLVCTCVGVNSGGVGGIVTATPF